MPNTRFHQTVTRVYYVAREFGMVTQAGMRLNRGGSQPGELPLHLVQLRPLLIQRQLEATLKTLQPLRGQIHLAAMIRR